MRIDILGGMGMETKEKAVQAQTGAAKGKKSRKKVWAVVIGVLLAVIVVAIAFIELSTLPRKDTADDVIYIGGMVSSDTVEYADGSGKGLLRNPVVKTRSFGHLRTDAHRESAEFRWGSVCEKGERAKALSR